MQNFDPNKAATDNAGIFGLPFSKEKSALIFLPVPWEATTSYGGGTSNGPRAIFHASSQIDLFDFEIEKPYEPGMFMQDEPADVRGWNEEAKPLASSIIAVGGEVSGDKQLEASLRRVNELSQRVNKHVYEQSLTVMKSGKILGLIGGDHACPLGAFKAAGETYGDFGILHFDAHSDTRNAYEGFQYSHASIMRNALEEVPQVKRLVQVGIRDFCEEEYQYTLEKKDRCKVFYDAEIQRTKIQGISWSVICKDIIEYLPKNIWISFDIDGLDPRYCPHTGTPVPGGLELHEATYLIREVVRSGRKILGFDLCEVAPTEDFPDSGDEWDANVGMRLLYKLAGWTLASQGKVKIRN